MNGQESNSIYSTTDLGLACSLFTHEHELVNTTPQNSRRLYYHFAKREDTDRLASAYQNGTLQVPAKKFLENYRALRAMAYAMTDNR